MKLDKNDGQPASGSHILVERALWIQPEEERGSSMQGQKQQQRLLRLCRIVSPASRSKFAGVPGTSSWLSLMSNVDSGQQVCLGTNDKTTQKFKFYDVES